MSPLNEVFTIPPPRKEECCPKSLGYNHAGYGSTGVADNTLARCPVCSRWWFSAPFYGSLGPTSVWRKIRWYHFGFVKRISERENRL